MTSPTGRTSSVWEKGGVAVLGGLLVVAGVIMLITPGPGWVTIGAGVAVWAPEYHWARRLLSWLKQRVQDLQERYRQAPKE